MTPVKSPVAPLNAPLLTDIQNPDSDATASTTPEWKYVPVRRTATESETVDVLTAGEGDDGGLSGPPVRIPITVKHGITELYDPDAPALADASGSPEPENATLTRNEDDRPLGFRTPDPREPIDDVVFGPRDDDGPVYLEEQVPVIIGQGVTLHGDPEGSILNGTMWNDHLIGSSAMIGPDAVDIIHGFGGDDYIEGWTGADIIFGGDGDDILVGGGYDDELTGGAGADVFHFAYYGLYTGQPGLDVITDFEVGVDRISFHNFLETEGNPTLADQIIAIQGDGGTLLIGERNGDRGLYEFAFLEGVDAVDVQPLIDDGSILA